MELSDLVFPEDNEFKDKERVNGETCSACEGSGSVYQDCACPPPKQCFCARLATCPFCNGRGVIDSK